MAQVLGRDLRPGDVVEVWWAPKRDSILALTPYTGGVSHLFRHGAQIARFAINAGGMTIDNSAAYQVVARGPEQEVADAAA